VTRALLFLSMCVAAGLGAAVGATIGHSIGQGGLLVGGFLGGAAGVIALGYLAHRIGWIRRSQRVWCIAGGAAGFVMAYMVALATLASPVGPILSTLLVGTGALFGALVGQSAHETA
jgi:hypothetical protein